MSTKKSPITKLEEIEEFQDVRIKTILYANALYRTSVMQ